MVDSYETPNVYPKLSANQLIVPLNDQKDFRLSKINKTKYYFLTEIKERELMGKKKYLVNISLLLIILIIH